MAHILVVDDEPVLRAQIARYLTRVGHQAQTAPNGKAALAAIDEGAIDLMITDINMPDMDGIEMLNQLRRKGSTLPVIAISGGGQFSKQLLLESAGMLGAVLTLAKPFDLDELGRSVEELLGP